MSDISFELTYMVLTTILFPLGIFMGRKAERDKVKRAIVRLKMRSSYDSDIPIQSYEWYVNNADKIYNQMTKDNQDGR